MAALMRMSKLVNSNAIRSVLRNGFAKNSTVTTLKTLSVTSKRNANKLIPFISRHQGTLSVSESLLQEQGQNDADRPAPRGVHNPVSSQGQGQRGRYINNVTLENRIQSLDQQIRRTGRVDRGQIFAALAHARREGALTEQQALVLIRASGSSLVKENPQSRQRTLREVLETLKDLVPKFDISHHNAILRTRLENKEVLKPAAVLADIEESHQLFPNRITYQLLISVFCENGDLSGATKILEHMKSQDIPVNEAVFHALMSGHLKQGDIEGAKDVFASMKASGLLPVAESYTAMMCGLAEKGDLAGIMQCKADAESEEVNFQSRHLFEVVNALAEHGHKLALGQFLSEVREQYSSRAPFNHEALNSAFRLVVLGLDAEAMDVFRCITYVGDPTYKDTMSKQLLEVMTIQNRSLDEITKTVIELEKLGFLTTPQLENVARWAIKEGNAETAIDTFKMMIAQGEEVHRLTLQPILRMKLQSNDVDGLCSFAAQLTKLFPLDKNTCYDIFYHVVEPLSKQDMSKEDVYTKLRENGLEESDIHELKVLDHLTGGNFAEASTLVSAKHVPGFAALYNLLARGYQSTHDLQGLIEFLNTLKGTVLSQIYFKHITTSTLTKILGYKSIEAEEAKNLVSAFMEQNFILAKEATQNEIVQSLQGKSTDQERLKEIVDSFKNVSSPQNKEMQVTEENFDELAAILENSPETLSTQQRNRIEMQLLKQYCRVGKVDNADQLQARMESRGFQFGADMQATLAIYHARYKKDLETAQKYKEIILAQERRVPARLSLAIALLHASEGNFDKVLAELSDVDHSDMQFKYQLVQEAEKLIYRCSKGDDPSLVKRVVNVLFDKGYVQPGTNSLLNHIMRAYIKKGEGDEIVSTLEEFVTKYEKGIIFSEVLNFFVLREDAERLQKVVDLLSTVRGEMDVLHHLAFSLVECDKLRQAKKILETPGLRAQMTVLNSGMEQYFFKEKVDFMKQMVAITKDLFGVNREDMLFWLIRVNAKQKEPKKALEVLTHYEEEGILPKPRTLRYLAKVLRSAEMDVPFRVPEVPEEPQIEKRELSTHDETILNHLLAGEVDQAMELRKSLPTKAETAQENVLVTAVQMLYKNKQPTVMRAIFDKLVEAGEVDTLLHIRPKLARNLSGLIHKTLFRAYVKSDRTEEFLTYVNGNINMLSKYLDANNVEFLVERKPELFPKLVAAIDKYQENHSENYNPANVLYNYYLLNEQPTEAEALLQQYPEMKSSLHLRYLLNTAVELDKEHVVDTVMKLVDGDKRSFMAHGILLKHHCDKGNSEKANELFQQGRAKGMELNNFGAGCLEAYVNVLQSNSSSESETLEKIQVELQERRLRRNADSEFESESTKSKNERNV